MKKFITFALTIALCFTLVSCGNEPSPVEGTSETTAETTAEFTTNKQGFIHFSTDFGDGWTKDKNRSTDVCLYATYKEADDSEAVLILSALEYTDGVEEKAMKIGNAVNKREESSGGVEEVTIDGIKFYRVCFDSYEHNGKRLCNMFGQTEMDEDGNYYFIEISIDNMSSDKLLEKIDNDLQTIKFVF